LFHGLQGSLEFDIRAVFEGFDPWRISILGLPITSIDLHSFIGPDDFSFLFLLLQDSIECVLRAYLSTLKS
jgi:hypothetical protein